MMITKLPCALLVWFVMTLQFVLGQAPSIKYASPQTFTTGMAVTVVKPANTGGTVPAIAYGQVATFAGTAGPAGYVNAAGAAARFNGPSQIAIDASGNLFVIDEFNYVIRKITPAGAVSTYAGSGTGGSVLNGPALQVTMEGASGIATDAAGNLYVTSDQVVLKITTTGVVSTVAGKEDQFGSANGQDTTATFYEPLGLTVDKNGNIYVMDSNNYLVRKITPTGLVSTLAGEQGVFGAKNGPGTTATFNNLNACVLDPQGNLYVTEFSDVRKIAPDGMVTTFAGSGSPGSADGVGTAASFNYLSAISIDALGNLYVSDGSNGTIRKITPDGTVSTLAGTPGATGSANGVGSAGRFGGYLYAAVNASGDVLVTDFYNNTIRKVSVTGYAIDKPLPTGLAFNGVNGAISGAPVAFSPATDFSVTGYNLSGSSTAKINITITGSLSFPLIAPQIYGVADFSPAVSTTGTITYTSSNSAVATIVSGHVHVVGVGTSTITAANGSTTLSQLLTVSKAPLIIIADNKSKNANTANPSLTITYDGFVNGESPANFATQAIISTPAATTSAPGGYPINISGATEANYAITFVAGTLTVLGGGITIAAPQLSYPAALKYTSGVAITPVSPANTGGPVPANAYAQIIAVAGLSGRGGYANGTDTAARFFNPNGIALDAAGNLYVADVTFGYIRKITPAGVVTTIAGQDTNQPTLFSEPAGVAVDASGNVYVTDTFNNEIKKITPQGVVSIFAGGGSQLDGQGSQASFAHPSGIAIDKSGNFYIADRGNYLVRKITPSGLVTTIAGQRGVSGSVNGKGSAAAFNWLNEITVDVNGNLYVTDDNVVRKITSTGLVSTLAGSGAYTSVDGKGAAASFRGPWGITAEPNGIVYVADGNRLRKITPGGVVSTVIGAANASGTETQNSVSFGFLGGLAIDPSGNLYACDEVYDFVAKITATGYTIDKILPPGLVFDATTGKISGTPTVAFPPTFFTINAYNIGGASTSIIKLSVAPSTNAALSALNVSSGALSPAFKSTTTGYTASVPNTTSSITVILTTADPNATITVNGTTVTSGSASAPIALTIGSNMITATVTAQDGATTKTYTVAVTRLPSNNAYLSNLKVTTATLSPVFNFKTFAYNSTVPTTTTSVTVTPTLLDASATVKVNGTTVASKAASSPIALAVGTNNITIVTTAQDGVTKQTYTLTVTRDAAGTNNAYLSNLKVTTATLSPAFAFKTLAYTSNVPNSTSSVTVTPALLDATASVMVNGTAVANKTASSPITLAVGSNTINVVVTAHDGITTNTYTVAITRAAGGVDTFDPGLSVNNPNDHPSLNDDIILVHSGLSPNGDGVNDFLQIDGILAYPDNKLSVMNRSGQLVFEATGYDNSTKVFDGHSNKNGQTQLPGTYFYQLDYTVNGVARHKTGFIVLKY